MIKTLSISLSRSALLQNFIASFRAKLVAVGILLFQSFISLSQTHPYYPPEVTNPSNQTYVDGMWYYTNDYYECILENVEEDGCLDYISGYELWRSDGTANGTLKLKLYTESGSIEFGKPSFPSAFIAINNYLYFINGEDEYNFELLKINNKSTEPTVIKIFTPTDYSYSEKYLTPSDYHLTNVDGILFFTADDDANTDNTSIYGKELWKSDGTTAGTVMVKDIRSGEASAEATDLRNENGLLYFTADDGNGRKLWKSDGTTQSTVKAVAPAGKIGREYWANVTGTTVSAIPLTTAPASTSQLTLFEGPSNIADNYGSRIRGYIQAPASGDYTFWIASNDNSELWLSTDKNPANKRKIASVTGNTAVREWTKYPSQKSVSIVLQKGKNYYIEALHKEAAGGDHIAVGWQLPDGTLERPIPGSRLSPLSAPLVSISSPAANASFTAGTSITVSAFAEDYVADITKVEFFANDTKLGEDAASPFTYYWKNIPAGTYNLTARAINNVGVATTSTVIPVISRQEAGTAKQWDKAYGGPSSDGQGEVIQTTDGGYLVIGLSNSEIGGDKSEEGKGGYDGWIVKSDANGNKEWDKTFGGSDYDELTSVVQTADGGYLLGGYSGAVSYSGVDNFDYWIVKVSSSGSKEWEKTFGGSSRDVLSAIIPISDGGYLLGGTSSSGTSGSKTEDSRGENDYWVVKISSNGTKQWDKTYGGIYGEQLQALVETTDGGFLLGGYSTSEISGEKTAASKGGTDFWVVKIDGSGAKQWDKAYGGSNADLLYSVLLTPDNGFLLAGKSDSPKSGDKSKDAYDLASGYSDGWVIKISSKGAKQWDKTYGGLYDEGFVSADLTPDGGYILGSTSQSPAGNDKTEDSRGSLDYWIVKLSNTGVKQWDRTFGGTDMDDLWSVITTSDGAYVLAGQSYSSIDYDKSEESRGFNDYWIVKTTPETQVPPVTKQVNFQNKAASVPQSWLKDYGQAFGARTEASQGTNLSYGWKRRDNSKPIDLSAGGPLSGNGRHRPAPSDVLLATLMHMQGNDVKNFRGVPVESYWEMAVENGDYQVTVSAGDGSVYTATDPESHSLTVEGVNAITNFVPQGAQGSLTRFKQATVKVTVNDGYLTIDADGGRNTKINYAIIQPLSVSTQEAVAKHSNTDNPVAEEPLKAYPNPFQDKLTIDLDRQSGNVTLTVVDLAGKPYYQAVEQVQGGGVSVDLSAAGLKAGVYFIKLQSEDGTSKTVRVVKK